MEKIRALYLHEKDNVATLLADVEPEDRIVIINSRGNSFYTIDAFEFIPQGHKIAVKEIFPGEDIYKYGEIIGLSTESIRVGGWVHVHNLESKRGRGDLDG